MELLGFRRQTSVLTSAAASSASDRSASPGSFPERLPPLALE
jgi:hypothetical protein